jgi:hypothetical protein
MFVVEACMLTTVTTVTEQTNNGWQQKGFTHHRAVMMLAYKVVH